MARNTVQYSEEGGRLSSSSNPPNKRPPPPPQDSTLIAYCTKPYVHRSHPATKLSFTCAPPSWRGGYYFLNIAENGGSTHQT